MIFSNFIDWLIRGFKPDKATQISTQYISKKGEGTQEIVFRNNPLVQICLYENQATSQAKLSCYVFLNPIILIRVVKFTCVLNFSLIGWV